MIFPAVPELDLVTVLKRGVANSEAVALQVRQQCNMGQFGLMVGYRQANGVTLPYNDALFWFGEGMVSTGDWIFLYTGSGEPRRNVDSKDQTKTYVLHWSREKTLFADSNVVPLLFRADAISIGEKPADVPQPIRGALTKVP